MADAPEHWDAVPLKAYVDAQLSEVRRAVEIAATAQEFKGVPLREFMESILEEQKRALDMAATEREKAASALREQTQRALDKADAEREKAASALRVETQRALDKADAEREKAASALRDEQYRAQETAAVEREKAASALRSELGRSIQEGDERLREHITQQIYQIREALISGEKLEMERVEKTSAKTEAVQRELMLMQDAAKEAVAKAEAANEKRFDAANEFRGQLADQTASFLPREVADAQFTELRKQTASNTERINKGIGVIAADDRNADKKQAWTIWAAGGIVTAIVTITIILANVLTGGP